MLHYVVLMFDQPLGISPANLMADVRFKVVRSGFVSQSHLSEYALLMITNKDEKATPCFHDSRDSSQREKERGWISGSYFFHWPCGITREGEQLYLTRLSEVTGNLENNQESVKSGALCWV